MTACAGWRTQTSERGRRSDRSACRCGWTTRTRRRGDTSDAVVCSERGDSSSCGCGLSIERSAIGTMTRGALVDGGGDDDPLPRPRPRVERRAHGRCAARCAREGRGPLHRARPSCARSSSRTALLRAVQNQAPRASAVTTLSTTAARGARPSTSSHHSTAAHGPARTAGPLEPVETSASPSEPSTAHRGARRSLRRCVVVGGIE